MDRCFPPEQLARLLTGELNASECETLDAHLNACSDCQRVLAELSDGEGVPLWRQLVQSALPTRASPPVELALLPNADAQPPLMSAPPGYEILGELGRGGVGIVYRARQVSLDRLVALKVLRVGGLADPEERARFFQEAEAVARLQHPHLVQIHEVGRYSELPFLALEYVEGGSLAQRLASTPQPPRQAAELVETLARAMQHAHERGIVHRDLKPGNVLLSSAACGLADTTEDAKTAKPQAARQAAAALIPKITDFGLAKRLDGGTSLTHTGAILGTPSYMAPEQAQGKKDVGPAADLYALGAILYECLTGRPPFRAETPYETLLQVVQHEPVAPRQLNPTVPLDLNTVCLKCLHKDPARRYATAVDLADDLARFLAGKPVAARPVGVAERAWKAARRNPRVAGLLALLVLVTALGFGLVVWQWQQALAARHLAEERFKQTRIALYASHMGRADREWRADNFGEALDRLADCPPEVRGWEWRLLGRLVRGSTRTLTEHGSPVCALTCTRQGTLASCGYDGLRLWPADGGPSRLLPRQGPYLRSIAASADGLRLAVGDNSGSFVIREIASGAVLHTYRGHAPSAVGSLAFSPDGRYVASGGGTARLWDARGREVLVDDSPQTSVVGVAFAPDSSWWCVARTNGVRLRRLPNQAPLATWNVGGMVLQRVAVSPDGLFLVGAGEEPGRRMTRLCVWALPTGKEVGRWSDDTSFLNGGLALHPNGLLLATTRADGGVRLWDLPTRKVVRTWRGHVGVSLAVAFSPDGGQLLSGGADALKIWDDSDPPRREFAGGAELAFSPDGDQMATAERGGLLRVRELATGAVVRSWHGHTGDHTLLAWGGQGRLASSGSDGVVKVWDLATGQELFRRASRATRLCPATLSPDGLLLAESDTGPSVRVWNLDRGERVQELVGPTEGIVRVAFSPDGLRLATVTLDWQILVWDLKRGRLAQPMPVRDLPVTGLSWSPDGRWLAASFRGKVCVWEARNGREVFVLPVHRFAGAVSFSPDGKRLAACHGNQVQVWEMTTGQQVLALPITGKSLQQVAFSPDGRRLAATDAVDHTVTVWDAGAP